MDAVVHEISGLLPLAESPGNSAKGFAYARERFPLEADKAFARMFRDHGLEVRDKPLVLAYGRYRGLDNGGRLGWFVARWAPARSGISWKSRDGQEPGYPVGYSSHWTYTSMHGPDLLGHDDLWYVDARFRGRGIGGKLKRMGHDWLKSQGCQETSDFVRHVSPEQMGALGFKQRGVWWVRTL